MSDQRHPEGSSADSPQGDLGQFIDTWDLTITEAARVFGVSPATLSAWLSGSLPPEQEPALRSLATTTRLLEQRVDRTRIPIVVRRQAAALDGRSLLQLAQRGEHAKVHRAVKEMFNLRRGQP